VAPAEATASGPASPAPGAVTPMPGPGPATSPTPSGGTRPGGSASSSLPAARTVLVPVITDPPGAAVRLDGQKVTGSTPLDLTVDPTTVHKVAVSLDSYASQEVVLEAGSPRSELRLRLEPAGPLATVTVASTYPLDVSWRGRSLARGEVSPRVQVPGGRQVLTVSAAAQFVKGEVVVTAAAGGAASVEAPALGRLSIRGNPDNCQVFVDGVFVDYPPILDKPVGAGPHVVSFKWPDGAEAKESVDVQAGKVSFVTGRKE